MPESVTEEATKVVKKVVKKVGPHASATTVSPSPVAGFIPDRAILDEYQPRYLGEVPDVDVFKSHYERKRHLLLEGPTSSGKTFAVTHFAAKMGLPLFTVSGAGGVADSDLFGRWVPLGVGETLIWADGMVTLAALFGGILYINESNMIPPDTLALLFGMMDFRAEVTIRGAWEPYTIDGETHYRERRIKCHPDLWIVVDGNPGYIGTGELNQAFRNRVGCIEWTFDPGVEALLITSEHLREFMAALRSLEAAGNGIYTPVTTKQFVDFEANVYALSWAFAIHSLLSYFSPEEREVVQATLDDGYATKLLTEYGIEYVEVDDADA